VVGLNRSLATHKLKLAPISALLGPQSSRIARRSARSGSASASSHAGNARTPRAGPAARRSHLLVCLTVSSSKQMRSVRTSSAVLITLLASGVVCGCTSVAARHAMTAEEPGPVTTPAVGTTTGSGTVKQVSGAAVASTAPGPQAHSKASHADSKLTCRTEAPPGSRVAVRICETVAQREAREAAVRDTKDSLNRPTPSCAKLGPSGCAGGG